MDKISILGYGCMRFTRKMGSIDMAKAEREVRLAIEKGVNYFDTAYMYPGSEKALGAILAKDDGQGGKLRDRVYVATKLPHMLANSREDLEKYLETSLERLGMPYVDYYLVHNLSSLEGWERCKRLGVVELLEQAKADGKIRHIGFSWHGNLHNFRKVVDDYPWEFCQIQYNYLDEHFQAGTEGLKYAAGKGLPVIAMEPLRGGTLAGRLPVEAARIVNSHKSEDASAGIAGSDASGSLRSPAYWALRWLWSHPEVTCVLSGMNDVSQVEENTAAAADAAEYGPLSSKDLAMVGQVKAVFEKSIRVNCTGCAYCVPCPHGVDIPFCLSALNSQAMFGGITSKIMYFFTVRAMKGKPFAGASACKKCGVCEKKCPQHIRIMEALDEAAKEVENPLLKGIFAFAGLFMGR